MAYPAVLDEWSTISLLHEGRSIARYGDGELKLCRGAAIKCQPYHSNLSNRLRNILKSKSDCLVGIPRLDTDDLNPDKEGFWKNYRERPYPDFYSPEKTYASAFISRPDSIPLINTDEYFDYVQQLWEGRHVVLVNGDNRPFDKNPAFVKNAKTFEKWVYPSQDAWAEYTKLLSTAACKPKSTLFLLALGPTATVLAYDLSAVGFQALDLGHIGMFYARAMNK